MPRKKDRVSIPEELAAKVLFVSDRICCVCRTKGKPVQIHHINEDPSDNSFENLAVICFDCHTETQISGGFHRKLNAEQVILYRNDWIVQVAHLRTDYRELAKAEAEDVFFDFEIVTHLAEIYRERKAFDLLAIHYDTIGNKELRDKYIDLAINNGLDDDGVIHFRIMQGKGQLIPQEVIARRVKNLQEDNDLFNLGRLYYNTGQYDKATEILCLDIINSIKTGGLFHAAYAIKEMTNDGLVEALFLESFKIARENNDLWWQYRSLQELGWYTEITNFLISNKQEIENSGNTSLKAALAIALGDKEQYKKALIREALDDTSDERNE